MKDLPSGDYKLTDGEAWFWVKGFSVRVHKTDEGVVVDMYQNGFEDRDAIASTYAFDNELEKA